jgi:transcriptional regulator with XRE-family HTH domain
MALGANVKKFREAAGLTQTQLAERVVGMTQQALGVLEKRDSKSSKFIPALADALGKSVDELLGTDRGDGSTRIPANYIDAGVIIELIALYGRSTQKGRQQILESARSTPKISIYGGNSAANGEA